MGCLRFAQLPIFNKGPDRIGSPVRKPITSVPAPASYARHAAASLMRQISGGQFAPCPPQPERRPRPVAKAHLDQRGGKQDFGQRESMLSNGGRDACPASAAEEHSTRRGLIR